MIRSRPDGTRALVMRARVLLAGVCLVATSWLLTACAGEERPPPADDADGGLPSPETTDRGPVPRFFTQETPDGRYTMEVGGSATLQLPQGTPGPAVRGDAVEVIEVAWFADPGVAQWELRGVEPGETTIAATVDGRKHVWTIIVEG